MTFDQTEGLEVRTKDVNTSRMLSNRNSDSYKYPVTYDTKEVVNRGPAPVYSSQFDASEPERKSGRIPWGLSPLAFAMIVALITALVVGGAVGGGVSAASSSSRKNCVINSNASSSGSTGSSSSSSIASLSSTSTSAATSAKSSTTSAASPTGTFANYVAPSASQVESLANSVCPSLDNTVVQSSMTGSKFLVACDQSITGGFGSNGTTLAELIAYSFIDCANACHLYNYWRTSTICTAVTWNSAMSKASLNGLSGNCWLFQSAAVFQTTANSTSARLQIS